MRPSDLPPDLSQDPDSLPGLISEEAGHCVACGLCLPHCPTYRLTLSEADSPRGRIALMNGAATGRIPMNQRFALHMDGCLTCRACEAACPNHVRFGELIDGAHALRASQPLNLPAGKAAKQLSPFRKWLERELIAKPARIDALRLLVRSYDRSGLQKWVRMSGILGSGKLSRLEAQLPFVDQPLASSGWHQATGGWAPVYPSTGKYRGEVGLFLGCVARLTDATTLNSAIFVLNRLGYTVHIPPAQTCCGALHQHAGDLSMATELGRRNAVAFNDLNLNAIISTASGCGVQLAERFFSPPLLSRKGFRTSPDVKARDIANFRPASSTKGNFAPVMDISRFLAMAEGWDEVKFSSLACKIAVHEPCTLRNVFRGAAHAYTLLARIPGAEIVALPGNDQCCGAAGTYFLDQPQMSRMLLHEKIEASNKSDARYLVTSNVGCAMHIASGLREGGSDMEVVHPVTLIARQMVI